MFGGGWRGASSWSLSPLPCKRRSGIRDCERADWEGCNDRAIKNKSNKKKKERKEKKTGHRNYYGIRTMYARLDIAILT